MILGGDMVCGRRGRVGEKSWRRSVERKYYSSSSSSTTFFFSNFPDSHGEYDMLKLFQRWARFKEVFISRRLNRWGRRFGFVRFFNVENVVSLERDLDRCYIGNRKLYVNLPRYHRDGYERKGDESKELKGLGSGGGDVYHNGLRKGKEVWREKRGKEGHTNDNVTQLYANVVRKRTQDQWKGPESNDQSNNAAMDDQ